MLKFISLLAYVIYFTSTQIKRFKQLCYYMDTLYLLRKIMQYSTPLYPLPACYPPAYRTPMPSRTWGMMMFAKFFWEIFLVKILDPFSKKFFFQNFWCQNINTLYMKNFFWEFLGYFFRPTLWSSKTSGLYPILTSFRYKP